MGPPVFALPVAIPYAAEVDCDHYASEPGGAGGRGLLLGILRRGGGLFDNWDVLDLWPWGSESRCFFENGQFKKKNYGKTRKREEKKKHFMKEGIVDLIFWKTFI